MAPTFSREPSIKGAQLVQREGQARLLLPQHRLDVMHVVTLRAGTQCQVRTEAGREHTSRSQLERAAVGRYDELTWSRKSRNARFSWLRSVIGAPARSKEAAPLVL